MSKFLDYDGLEHYNDKVQGQISQLGLKVDVIIEEETVQSPNLFNKMTAEQGKGVSQTSGVTYTAANMTVSDYIAIPTDISSFYLTHLRVYGVSGWAIYDANKTYLRGGNTQSINIVSGDAYLRFTILTTDIDIAMAVVGTQSDVPPEYVPFGELNIPIVKENSISSPNIQDGAITEQKLAEGAINKNNAAFVVKTLHSSKNLLNPDACESGYVNYQTGAIASVTSRYATDYIPVDESGFKLNCYNGYGSLGSWAIYDENKRYVRGGYSNPQEGYTYQSGDVYIRITISTGGVGSTAYIVRGDDIAEYSDYYAPFYTYELSTDINFNKNAQVPKYEPAASLTGLPGSGEEAATLSGSTVFLSGCPQYLKREFNLSFDGKISTFSHLDIGVGKDAFNGTFVRIDATNIYLYRFTDSEQLSQTQAHGLTISDFINVSVYMDNGILTARIGSINGIFKHSFNRLGDVDSYGVPFVTAPSETSLVNYSFKFAGVNFRKPIWVIGDSYVTWYPQRWPLQLVDTFGVSNFMLDGLAGGHSTAMYAELIKLLEYGTPKFLIWCLGMNDTYVEWLRVFGQLKELCARKGITLILQTIPWPTNWENNEKPEINAAIKASGYRYIDGYAAVSSDEDGHWYTDYCQDGVHTSVIGAKAMASRFLADFPEFLQ